MQIQWYPGHMANNRLTREFPDRAENLFERNEENAKARYEHLQRLIEMYK